MTNGIICSQQLMDINESPVYVLLNPAINPAQKDLPVTIYESGMYFHLLSPISLKACYGIACKVALVLITFV